MISDVKATEKRWRETGFNAGVRGYGTSKRTFYRNNAKVAQRVASGEGSTGLMSWLRSHTSTDNLDLASSISTFEAEANDDVDIENNIENDETDYLEYNDIFDKILNCDTNEEGTRGSSSSSSSNRNNRSNRTSNKEIVKNKYSRTEAIALLLNTHGNVSRNVAVELKKGLQHYQILQATAIAKYFQLLEEGTPVMKASYFVASFLYRKTAKNSYKARCIRGWASYYLQTGELREFLQGTNVKTTSVITDENVASLFKSHLRLVKDENQSPMSFQSLLNESLLMEIPGAPRTISR